MRQRIMPFNPLNAQPSYQDMDKTKPVAKLPREDRNIKSKELPVKFLTCDKCHKFGGTLIKIEQNVYMHQECAKEEVIA